ncbi:MAG: helix-turn-helix domain-containing protein [Bacteroidetes bacterium]|nr:helix-turn-helix domain-containing protein [Bacteroidota bacterium]
MLSSTDYFVPLGRRLRDEREDQDLDISHAVKDTHLRAVWIRNLETGNFEFAEPVFIKGYLRQYAQFLKMNVDEILAEYETIVEKVHYLENERFVEVRRFDADTDVSPLDVLDVLREQADETGITELDARVREKVLREKRVNLAVMITGAVLTVLTGFYMYLDFGRAPETTPYWKIAEPTMLVPRVAPKTTTRARMVLSDPLLTDVERELRVAEGKFIDSLRLSDQRFTANLRSDGVIEPVSIYESANYLRQLYAQ